MNILFVFDRKFYCPESKLLLVYIVFDLSNCIAYTRTNVCADLKKPKVV